MRNFVISIGPPRVNRLEQLLKFYNDQNSTYIDTREFLERNVSDIGDDLSAFSTVIVDGENASVDLRGRIRDRILTLNEKADIKFVLFSIPKYQELYNIFLADDFSKALPTYVYYDYLSFSDISNSSLIKIDSTNDSFRLLEDGSKSVIVNIKTFFVGISKYKVNLDIPRELKSVRINTKLKRYLRHMQRKDYNIYLSYCSDQQYSHINNEHLMSVIKTIENNIELPISGMEIDWGIDGIRTNKPNPWHLFKMMKEFGINPRESIYIGQGDTDRIFSDNSGIGEYIDCDSVRILDKMNKQLEYIL